jgi:hypothetical protein
VGPHLAVAPADQVQEVPVAQLELAGVVGRHIPAAVRAADERREVDHDVEPGPGRERRVMLVNDVEDRLVAVEARAPGDPPLEPKRLADQMLAHGRAARAPGLDQRIRKALA